MMKSLPVIIIFLAIATAVAFQVGCKPQVDINVVDKRVNPEIIQKNQETLMEVVNGMAKRIMELDKQLNPNGTPTPKQEVAKK